MHGDTGNGRARNQPHSHTMIENETNEQAPRSPRGFAALPAERQREIASKGGKTAHERGTAHEFSHDEARAAGQKGGRSVSRNREHMSRIGREGGRRAHAKQKKPELPSERGTARPPPAPDS
jgi:general stress protein YciG